MDPLTITRSIRIEAGADAVWASVADPDGLAGWLGGSVDVDLSPGSAGSFVDDDGTRRLVVTEVAEGRALGFVWWDDARPDDASAVRIDIAADGEGTRVTVTETLDPVGVEATGRSGGRASARSVAEVGDLAALGGRWDDRLGALIGRVAPALVVG